MSGTGRKAASRGLVNELVAVYRNGLLLSNQKFADIRKRALERAPGE